MGWPLWLASSSIPVPLRRALHGYRLRWYNLYTGEPAGSSVVVLEQIPLGYSA